jgi:hypothetical protein
VLRGAAGAVGLTTMGGLAVRGLAPAAAEAAPTPSPAPLSAPQMTVLVRRPGAFPGQIFFTYGSGVEIADSTGTPLWSTSESGHYEDFQMQTYRGEPVLTWWQGTGTPAGGGTGVGTCVLTSLSHEPVATINGSDGYYPDLHELRITPANTALITSYRTVPYDLSPVGGPAVGRVLDSYCEEVDIASGTVLLRWSALDHVPLSDSYVPVPPPDGPAYDFFHLNSISITPDGHLLLSARHTCAAYKIHRTSGEVIWQLGGKSSSFAVAPDAVFAYQHHAIFENPRTIRLFDDGSDGQSTVHQSRVAWIRLDSEAMTASLADNMTIPGIQSGAMGSAQRLPNGNVFVSWGSTPRLSEFSPRGDVLFDATLTAPSYRAFKYPIG